MRTLSNDGILVNGNLVSGTGIELRKYSSHYSFDRKYIYLSNPVDCGEPLKLCCQFPSFFLRLILDFKITIALQNIMQVMDYSFHSKNPLLFLKYNLNYSQN